MRSSPAIIVVIRRHAIACRVGRLVAGTARLLLACSGGRAEEATRARNRPQILLRRHKSRLVSEGSLGLNSVVPEPAARRPSRMSLVHFFSLFVVVSVFGLAVNARA